MGKWGLTFMWGLESTVSLSSRCRRCCRYNFPPSCFTMFHITKDRLKHFLTCGLFSYTLFTLCLSFWSLSPALKTMMPTMDPNTTLYLNSKSSNTKPPYLLRLECFLWGKVSRLTSTSVVVYEGMFLQHALHVWLKHGYLSR